jgi:hypothetical protein
MSECSPIHTFDIAGEVSSLQDTAVSPMPDFPFTRPHTRVHKAGLGFSISSAKRRKRMSLSLIAMLNQNRHQHLLYPIYKFESHLLATSLQLITFLATYPLP